MSVDFPQTQVLQLFYFSEELDQRTIVREDTVAALLRLDVCNMISLEEHYFSWPHHKQYFSHSKDPKSVKIQLLGCFD